jgi:hypothetical protein
MGLGGNSRKIFEFKGVIGKIFINQSLTGVGWLSVVKERRFESRFGSRKSNRCCFTSGYYRIGWEGCL